MRAAVLLGGVKGKLATLVALATLDTSCAGQLEATRPGSRLTIATSMVEDGE